MDLFNAKIIEADSTFYSGTMQSLVVPTIDGQYGVLAHHQNLMVAVIPGLLKFMDEEGN